MALQFLLICRVLLMQCGGRGHYISHTKEVSLTVFSQSFPGFSQTHYIERNLNKSYISDWTCTTTGFPQGSLLNPFTFLVFTADMTLKEPKQTPKIPTESKYADDFEFWRIGTDFYHLLIQIQIAIMNLQTWCLKWQISINTSKTLYYLL